MTTAERQPSHATKSADPRIIMDNLGKLILRATHTFQRSQNWEQFVDTVQGDSDIPSDVSTISHSAGPLLDRYRRKGVPALSTTPPWTQERRDQAVRRGPHTSAKEHQDFVRDEFTDFVNKQFWTVLPYRLIKTLRDLRVSPLGVVPQRERRPRLIVDLSFYNVNQETVPLAPLEAMQFGRTLQRLLQKLLDADPAFGNIYMSKLDIADGFYRVQLAPRDIPRLGVLLPTKHGEEPLVAFPLVLPMGWILSPPYFCAATETVADILNQHTRSLPPTHTKHRLEDQALLDSGDLPQQPIASDTTTHKPRLRHPLRYTDVYVDDFIALCQGDPLHRRRIMRHMLHTLDQVFRPVQSRDNPFRQEPASTKKMAKGDTAWATRKLVLGWIIDTVTMTLELPEHRQHRLREILDTITPSCKRVGIKRWQKILGELRSMVLAIPGSRGLFSTLQHALKYGPDGRPRRVRLTKAVHQFITDFRALSHSLSERPTSIAETIPRQPSILGVTDAARLGMGGAAFIHTTSGERPILWRARFPTSVTRDLVSSDHPRGRISISDLELSATYAHHDILSRHCDLQHHTIHTWHDNAAAIFWQRKGSANTAGPAAYLLRLQAHHQRNHRYVPLHSYLPGPLNNLADDCSRLWHLDDNALLTHFQSTYPQARPWELLHLPSDTLSCVTSALHRQASAKAWSREPSRAPKITGSSGAPSATNTTSTTASAMSLIPYHTSKSSRSDTANAQVTPPATSSSLQQWRERSDRLVRRWPRWGPLTPEKTPPANSTSGWDANSGPMAAWIRRQCASNPFQLPSYDTWLPTV